MDLDVEVVMAGFSAWTRSTRGGRGRRRRRDRTPASCGGPRRVFRVDAGLARELLDREVGRTRTVGTLDTLEVEEARSSRFPRTSSAKRFSASVVSLIWICQRRWSTSDSPFVRFCSIGGSSSKPPRLAGRGLLERAVLEELLPSRSRSSACCRSFEPRRSRGACARRACRYGARPAPSVDGGVCCSRTSARAARNPHRRGPGSRRIPLRISSMSSSRELQQADRLLELRSHNELLAGL